MPGFSVPDIGFGSFTEHVLSITHLKLVQEFF